MPSGRQHWPPAGWLIQTVSGSSLAVSQLKPQTSAGQKQPFSVYLCCAFSKPRPTESLNFVSASDAVIGNGHLIQFPLQHPVWDGLMDMFVSLCLHPIESGTILVWRCTPTVPAVGRLRQQDWYKPSLSYIVTSTTLDYVRLYLQISKENKTNERTLACFLFLALVSRKAPSIPWGLEKYLLNKWIPAN